MILQKTITQVNIDLQAYIQSVQNSLITFYSIWKIYESKLGIEYRKNKLYYTVGRVPKCDILTGKYMTAHFPGLVQTLQ